MRPTPEQRARVLALHTRGVAKGEIAERLDLPRGTVAALLRRRPTFTPRACRLCGEPFVPTNGRQRYCTKAHWLEHQRSAPTIRRCRLCGEPFAPSNGRQRYCTKAHWLEHQRSAPTTRRCRLCGEPFTPSNGRQRFCTPAHQREHARRHGPPRTTAGWRQRVDALEAEIARVRAQLDEREAA